MFLSVHAVEKPWRGPPPCPLSSQSLWNFLCRIWHRVWCITEIPDSIGPLYIIQNPKFNLYTSTRLKTADTDVRRIWYWRHNVGSVTVNSHIVSLHGFLNKTSSTKPLWHVTAASSSVVPRGTGISEDSRPDPVSWKQRPLRGHGEWVFSSSTQMCKVKSSGSRSS